MSKRFWRTCTLWLFIAMVGGLLSACDRTDPSTSKSPTPSGGPAGSASVTRPDAVVRDAVGVEFTGLHPQRIISTAPNITEILFALGAGDRVVGVTTNCDFPPEAARIEKIGDFNLNYEKIVALAPDLVVVSLGFTDGAREVLAPKGIPVFTLSHASFSEILESIQSLAVLLDAEPAATRIVQAFDAAARRAKERADSRPRPRVLWVQWNDPLSTIGPGNFQHDLIELAGGENVARDLASPYGQFSEEVVVTRNPEVVLVPSEAYATWVRNRFPEIDAVRNGRIFVFNSDAAVRPGPRLVEALDALSQLLYPDTP